MFYRINHRNGHYVCDILFITMYSNQTVSSQFSNSKKVQQFTQFHKDRNKPSIQNQQGLKLQACQKLRNNFNEIHNHHHPKGQKDISSLQKHESYQFKKPTERFVNLLLSLCSSITQTSSQRDNTKVVIHSFARDMQDLMDKYISKLHSFRLQPDKKEEVNKKLLLFIDQTMRKEFINEGDTTVEQSQNGRQLSNKSHDSNKLTTQNDSLNKNSTFKPSTSQFTIEQRSITKGPISKIESSFMEVNRLLEKVGQPRFIRKGGLLNSKQNRQNSSSIEDIMSRSIEQRKRRDHSDSNSKETIYKINRLLNE